MSFLPGRRLGLPELRQAQVEPAARERLIQRFIPFVLRVASRTSGRYLRLGQDDEVSVALIAFNEAIDHFDTSRNTKFLSFAETVIKRRLIDHFRREAQKREVPLSALATEDGEGQAYTRYETDAAIAADQAVQEAETRRAEIDQYAEELAQFGISFSELVTIAPRHRDARQSALAIARLVAQTGPWIQHLRARRSLPLKAIAQHVSISRKTLERQRKYVIAAVLAMIGPYPFIQEYFAEGGDG